MIHQVAPGFPGRIDEVADRVERQRAQHGLPIDLVQAAALGNATSHRVHPPAEKELERAAGIRNLLLPPTCCRTRHHARQVLGTLRSRGPLGPARIRQASRADPTGAPRLPRHPLDHIMPVIRIVEKRPPLPFRFPATAAIDRHERVAVALEKLPFRPGSDGTALVVGSDGHDRRRRSFGPMRQADERG